MQQQKRRLAKKVENEKLITSALPDLSINIMDQAQKVGRVSLSDMVTLTRVSRNTLKVHFRNLVNAKLLIKHGAGKATWYGLA